MSFLGAFASLRETCLFQFPKGKSAPPDELPDELDSPILLCPNIHLNTLLYRNMVLSVFGINHKTATLSEREPFQLTRRELGEAVLQLKRLSEVEEVAIVATCNRVEFYRVHPTKGRHGKEIVEFYRNRGIANPEVVLDFSYRHIGAGAARHLFRVISGMDSLVVGEEQIRGQVKDAYSQACAFGGPGKVLHKLFHHGFRVSKRIKSETELGTGARSVPGAAVELLLEKLPQPEHILVIGANETTEAVLTTLTRKGLRATLVNRTEYVARKMAASFGSEVGEWEELSNLLQNADVVFTATGAPGYVVKNEMITGRERPLFMADLAVPRDIDPAVAEIDKCHVFDLQDLKHELEQTAERRCSKLPDAQEIVEQQVAEFLEWMRAQTFAGGIEALKEDLHAAADDELERFKGSFHKKEYKALDAYGHALIKRFLKLAKVHFEPGGHVEDAVLRIDPAAIEVLGEIPIEMPFEVRSEKNEKGKEGKEG